MPSDAAVIIANGEFSASPAQLEDIRKAKHLIAVDGGIEHCIRAKLYPHLLVGDFDSVSDTSLAVFGDVPKVALPSDKDESDLEVAIKRALEITQGPLLIFGAGGGRTDHLLYNLYLLARYAGRTSLESEKERLFVIREGRQIASTPGQILSLLPLNGLVQGVSSKGLKWELSEAKFDKHWMSLSNVCQGREVTISVTHGDLLCCMQLR